MPKALKDSARKFKIYMTDSADPLAGKTGLASFTVKLAKDSAAEATVSPTITERGGGWYEVTPLAAHRDTLGESAWTFTHAGANDFVRLEEVEAMDPLSPAYPNLEKSGEAILWGAAVTGTLSTTVMTSDLTGYGDDILIGRSIIWYSGPAAGQASTITDYASTNGTVTYDPITTVPVNGDSFVIL